MAEVEGQGIAGRCRYALIGSEACGNAQLEPLVDPPPQLWRAPARSAE